MRSAVAIGVAGGLAVVTWIWLLTTGYGPGIDYAFYRELGLRVVSGGPVYLPHQLAGPYDVGIMVDNLYPPSALPLFIATLITPAIAWWLVPLGVTAYCIGRPSRTALVAILLVLAWPRAAGALLYGNTDMWVMAAVAAGLRWGWPALAVTLKPVFAPLALLGVRRRSWWVAAGLGLVFVAATWPLWMEYLTVMRNLRIAPSYSVGSIPLVVLPLVLHFASTGPRVTVKGAGVTVTSKVPV